MAQPSPQKVGKYVIRKRLGQGGMGVVYVGYDSMLQRDVAIKVMASAIGDDPKQKVRFEREARSIAQLSHPNIVTIHDLGYDEEGYPYLAMELLKGQDLEHILKSDPPLLRRRLEIMIQVCEGLSHAHSNAIVHRDVKPANIFVTDDGGVKLVDFGLARFTTAESQTLAIVGTRHYISPEQIRAQPVDGRTDIFAVGVILYRILSGRMPFANDEDGLEVVFYNTLHGEPRPLTMPDGSKRPDLEAIVFKALARDVAERYQKVEDMAADIRATIEAPKTISTGAVPKTERVPLRAAQTAVREASEAIDSRNFLHAKAVITEGRKSDPSNPVWRDLQSRLTSAEAAVIAADVSQAISRRNFDRAKTLISRGAGLSPSDPRWAQLDDEISSVRKWTWTVRAGGLAAIVAAVAVTYLFVSGPQPTTAPVALETPVDETASVTTTVPLTSTTSTPVTTSTRGASTSSVPTSSAPAVAPPNSGRAEVHALAAEAALALTGNDLAKAENLIRRGRALDPTDPRFPELERRVEAAKRERTDSDRRARAVDTYLKQAAARMESEDYDGAIAAYDAILSIDELHDLAIRGKNEAVILKRRRTPAVVATTGLKITEDELVWIPPPAKGGGGGFKPVGVVGSKATGDAAAPGSVTLELRPLEVRPGDPYVLRVRVNNDTNRPLNLKSMEVVWEFSGKPASGRGQSIEPRSRQVAPKAATVVHEVSGNWRSEQESGSVTATITLVGDAQLVRTIRW